MISFFLKIGHSLISRLDKKNQESGQKKLSGLWDRSICFWPTKKNKKLTGQLVGQETDQNHMDIPIVLVNFQNHNNAYAIKSQSVDHAPFWKTTFLGQNNLISEQDEGSIQVVVMFALLM